MSILFVSVVIYLILGFLFTMVAVMEIVESDDTYYYEFATLSKILKALLFIFFCGPGYAIYLSLKEFCSFIRKKLWA